MPAKKINFFIQQTRLHISADELWVLLVDQAFYARISPLWMDVKILEAPREFEIGSDFKLLIKSGLLKGIWHAQITHLRPGYLIGMSLLSPELKEWVVWTKCLPGDSKTDCILEDRIEYPTTPLLGKTRKRTEDTIRNIIYYKHRTLKNDLKIKTRNATPKLKKILIAGGSGFTGSFLKKFLVQWGYEVDILSTRQETNYLYWDPAKGLLDSEILEKKDAIINLCGSSVACRWSLKNKKNIRDSRIDPTHLLVKSVNRLKHPPQVFIQVSATGYYGYDNREELTESAAAGSGFLAELCKQWEAEAQKLEKDITQLKIVRLGAVISPQGGLLGKLIPLFKVGLGSRLGKGNQYLPWISINDLIYLFWMLLEKEDLTGTFNACVLTTTDNRKFTKTLAHAFKRRTCLPVPSFVLQLIYGKMAKEVLLGGCNPSPKKALENGIEFFDESLAECLEVSLGKI